MKAQTKYIYYLREMMLCCKKAADIISRFLYETIDFWGVPGLPLCVLSIVGMCRIRFGNWTFSMVVRKIKVQKKFNYKN